MNPFRLQAKIIRLEILSISRAAWRLRAPVQWSEATPPGGHRRYSPGTGRRMLLKTAGGVYCGQRPRDLGGRYGGLGPVCRGSLVDPPRGEERGEASSPLSLSTHKQLGQTNGMTKGGIDDR